MVKLDKKELQIISYLRLNARNNLTKISRATGIPVSTIFDKIKSSYEARIIIKHTTLLDFSKLGYSLRVNMILRANSSNKEDLKRFLLKNGSVNSIYKINNGYDFLVELVFKDLNELQGFSEKIDEFKVKDKKEFFILEDLKREAFLANPRMVDFL